MIKLRTDPSANYRAVFIDGKTIRTPIDPKKPITELAFPEFYDISFGTRCATGNCPWCTTPDAPVNTPSGVKSIADLKVGDKVFTLNERTLKQEIKPVQQLHRRPYVGEMILIELESGKNLQLTPNHKVMTQRGWVEAGDLQESDEVLSLTM